MADFGVSPSSFSFPMPQHEKSAIVLDGRSVAVESRSRQPFSAFGRYKSGLLYSVFSCCLLYFINVFVVSSFAWLMFSLYAISCYFSIFIVQWI